MRIIGNVKDAKSLLENERLAYEQRIKRLEHERMEPQPAAGAPSETEVAVSEKDAKETVKQQGKAAKRTRGRKGKTAKGGVQ